ncbi:NAD(P) transhydrogenase subunit beta [Porphyromonas macacae]|uniref:proton-translocating NAD(P)(+) transhydrogenase n=3 Tax=Porphyromonas macacae TaxID=28115 RepID=A0A379DIF3_9PORP|nr:NAD(P)(+) transhydrogenase (Re/Si-specific) subunit beta [Porphyromonas macacae]SUB77744.1 NAD(P) transhydrogenase subunit beta [Porphyromonas macacae]
MSALFYLVACVILSIAVMVGIAFMSKVTTARLGNSISSVAMLLGIILILVHNQILAQWVIYVALFIGGAIGFTMAKRVKMIQMPQMVALLNGIGGAASAVVGIISALSDNTGSLYPMFERATAYLAIVIGMTTLVGSLVAAGKLHKVLPQRPLVWSFHSWGTSLSLIISFAFIVIGTVNAVGNPFWIVAGCFIFSSLFGLYFSVRVGGADMPITISLLNSLSGVAASIAGMAVGDVLLVSVGAIVGASGLLLTQIMCRAMNRSLMSILLGTGAKKVTPKTVVRESGKTEVREIREEKKETKTAGSVLASAKNVIIVPGYGMALAQAQHQVKQLADKLSDKGANVRYAIHPVAGRMPGHMNVLLCEADVPYEQQFAMEEINDDFEKADVAIVIGANDVLNPAARHAEGTPIYGMPVLNVDQCPEIIICNFDLKPGYAGVDNPIYSKEEGVFLKLGDAKESLKSLMEEMSQPGVETASAAGVPSAAVAEKTAGSVLASAKNVIIVPGYGMALAQAQHQVKQLADKLSDKGANVRYAIHPVAGRMPGHMNVLLCEADVPYEQQFAMEEINDDFEKADVAIVIGANDVLNPAARHAEGTPIYGMPVLNVDQCPEIIICNFDLKPGYAGVDNPIYAKEKGVYLFLGDAKESLKEISGTL